MEILLLSAAIKVLGQLLKNNITCSKNISDLFTWEDSLSVGPLVCMETTQFH